MINAERKAYLELHAAVLLFGFTAILGDLITLSALELVWYRVSPCRPWNWFGTGFGLRD